MVARPARLTPPLQCVPLRDPSTVTEVTIRRTEERGEQPATSAPVAS